MADKTYILNKIDIERKLQRLAFEVMENNLLEKELVIAGITTNGVIMATRLQAILKKETTLSVSIVNITLDKKDPGEVLIEPAIDFSDKSILVVDDVSMTGKTMLYALQPFLAQKPKKIQTMVLVERELKNFPVQSNFVGLHISTTLQELIIVEAVDGVLENAYLI